MSPKNIQKELILLPSRDITQSLINGFGGLRVSLKKNQNKPKHLKLFKPKRTTWVFQIFYETLQFLDAVCEIDLKAKFEKISDCGNMSLTTNIPKEILCHLAVKFSGGSLVDTITNNLENKSGQLPKNVNNWDLVYQ